jgi:hypothetical protein
MGRYVMGSLYRLKRSEELVLSARSRFAPAEDLSLTRVPSQKSENLDT